MSHGGGATRGGLTREQQRLVEEALHVVAAITRIVHRRYRRAEHDEIHAAGYEALVRTARNYDPEEGASFVSFAWLRVYFAVREAAQAPALSPAAVAALDGAGDLRDGTSLFGDGDEDFERHVLESGIDVGAGYTLAFAGDVLRRMGEDGWILLEDRARSAAALQAVIATLPDEDRRVVRMRLLERHKARDVAAALGVSKSTIDRRCAALRVRLRHALEEQDIHAAPVL